LHRTEALSRSHLVYTVALTLGVQAFSSMGLQVAAVLAPVAAADLGVDPTRLGLWMGLAFMTAMIAGLVCGTLVGRYGPVRMLQAAVVCVGTGLALGATPSLLVTIGCAVVIGAGHGLVNPASSTMLMAASPPSMRSLIFSIKQTGVPVGGALAGMLLPALVLSMHWRSALVLVASCSLAIVLVLLPFRPRFDQDRSPEHRLSLRGIVAPIAEVCADRPVLALAIASGIFSAVQTSLTTYLVTYLKLELTYSLVAAGMVYAVAQFAGIAGRVLWGTVADRWVRPRVLLALLGFVMALCAALTALLTPSWPIAGVVALALVFGATAIGWNGVFLAEVARLAPPGRVAVLTGGTQFFTFSGGLIGPPTFGVIAAIAGSFSLGFMLFAALPLLTGLWLLMPRRLRGMPRTEGAR
jgi:MFS family permease